LKIGADRIQYSSNRSKSSGIDIELISFSMSYIKSIFVITSQNSKDIQYLKRSCVKHSS
jgi:hypothetical protein